jgi:hypothetical protein
MSEDSALYPGERDALSEIIYDISRRIILDDPNASNEARHGRARQRMGGRGRRDESHSAWAEPPPPGPRRWALWDPARAW